MIDFSKMKKLTVGGVALKKLAINGVEVWKSGYTNRVPLSINADGTIYNGKGYKDGYRIRSGGAEGSSNGACTGYIPARGGDVVRLSGAQFGANQTANAINVSDGSFANIGQITPSYGDAGYGIFASGAAYQSHCWKNTVAEESDGVWKWTVPQGAGIAYIRVSGYTSDGSGMIVTVNEEIG